jgi:hypothetical protein
MSDLCMHVWKVLVHTVCTNACLLSAQYSSCCPSTSLAVSLSAQYSSCFGPFYFFSRLRFEISRLRLRFLAG